MMRLTFRVVGLTLFSTDVEGDADEIGDALAFLLAWTNDRTEALLRVPLWLPTPGNVRFRRARERFDTLVYRIIRERRRQPEQKGDLLDMLLSASGEMSQEQVRDELITLAGAGHETTANALSWTFYLLSKHPEVERRVQEEVREVLGDRPPALSDLAALEYTERVIMEAMRLHPPVWGFERQAVEEDVIGGQPVTPGTFVMIVPYSIHRDPRYWTNPEGFDPDRFLPEAREARPRFAYLPFGGGPRVCIGNAFAMMEAKIVLAMVVRQMRLELIPGHRIVEEPLITLRPKDGVLASVRSRAQSTAAARRPPIPPRHVEATPGPRAP
jgi:cytochrome P450